MFTTFVHRLRGRLATGRFDFGPDVIADCTGSEFGRLAGAGVAGLRRSLVWAFGSLTTSGLGPFSESNANTNASYAFFHFRLVAQWLRVELSCQAAMPFVQNGHQPLDQLNWVCFQQRSVGTRGGQFQPSRI